MIAGSPFPLTTPLLIDEFRRIGVMAGMHLLLHSSLSRLGYVIGGAPTVIDALLHVLTPEGTLIVPTQSADNSEPSYWEAPPIPPDWWPLVRDHMPAFHPAYTPTRMMGRIAETARQYLGAKRSQHPAHSFAAIGKQADYITANHTYDHSFGEQSPLARLYELDAWVMLLGVGHSENTSLHLAEERAQWPGKRIEQQGGAVMIDGVRQWVEYEIVAYDDSDFPQIGAAYEQAHAISTQRVGQAETRLLRQPLLIDFGVKWIEAHRI